MLGPLRVEGETGKTLRNTHPIAAGCHAIRSVDLTGRTEAQFPHSYALALGYSAHL